jgi:antitoxin CcdA
METNMKSMVYNPKARKKPTNVSINSDLLRQAKDLKINLSQTLEEQLFQLVLDQKAQAWKKKNREAIEAYNRRIEKHGVFSDGLRRF